MGRKRTAGLFKRGEYWHIDKAVCGHRIRESTGTAELNEAEQYLAKRTEEIRQAKVFGVRPVRTFEDAACKYVAENQHKVTLHDDIYHVKVLMPFIGHLSLDKVHMSTLQPFIEASRQQGKKARTINHGLQVVRRILNLAAGDWLDEHALSWLHATPKIKLLPEPDLRKPYPLSWEEQQRLFEKLPPHLRDMALFAVNTGCRASEICALRWDWEVVVPELDHRSVFIIPAEYVKNRDERLVVLNEAAYAVVERKRGEHPEYVFTYQGHRLQQLLTSAWKRARIKAGLPTVRVHDLKHTFGRRLRAAGVGIEDRQDLLGHRSGKITTHYSAAELQNLFEAANRVSREGKSGLTLTLLKRTQLHFTNPHKIPTMGIVQEQIGL